MYLGTKHTGSQIIVVSASNGIYKVWPDISLPTRRRILQLGIIVRLVSINKPPSYVKDTSDTPTFIYKWFIGNHRRYAQYDPFRTRYKYEYSKTGIDGFPMAISSKRLASPSSLSKFGK